MRFKLFLIAMLVMGMGSLAYAELQNVEVGGSIRIRANWYNWDDDAEDSYIEQRTRLNVKADFTDDVSAFIELDNYDFWGEDFRSDYLTGADGRAVSIDDVEMYQAYIEASEMWGAPISMRVGRQEISLGNEMFMGVNDAASIFTGLSFDALVLTYANDVVSIQAMMAKLAETFGDIFDDDTDLYGIYGSYVGIEDVVIDGYWLYVRDEEVRTGNEIDIHTLGLRGAGVMNAFDFEAEIAYQIGGIEDVPWILWWDTEVDYSTLAANVELGYTFDMEAAPRLFAKFAYYGGGDLADNSRDWLWWWGNQEVDMPFNRLFSNIEYSEFLENTALSNIFYYAVGVEACPTESLHLALIAAYFDVDQALEGGRWFWSWEADDELGWEVGLYADYNYSEDLVIRAGYAHFFAGDGMDEGNLVVANGLLPYLDDDDNDYDYLFVETEISF